jgi:hypothetical protein
MPEEEEFQQQSVIETLENAIESVRAKRVDGAIVFLIRSGKIEGMSAGYIESILKLLGPMADSVVTNYLKKTQGDDT